MTAGCNFLSLCAMKKSISGRLFLLVLPVLLSLPAKSQQAISLDFGAIRQTLHDVNGFNLSGFYFFTKHLSGGVEMNRFFPVHHGEEEVSAWDFDFNFHYLFDLHHHLYVYPITGISHTSEKEVSLHAMGEAVTDRFWSVNAGAGLLWQKGKWGIHTEYLSTWGHFHQEFVLAGVNFEFELGKHHRQAKKHH